MSRYFKNRAGQNINEYAILLGVVVAALLAMQIPAKWAILAHMKDIIKDFKGYEFSSKLESDYSRDLGSTTNTEVNSQINQSMSQYSGYKTVTKDYQPDSRQTKGESRSESYEYIPPE